MKLPNDLVKECYHFARAVSWTTDYGQRGQADAYKRVRDAALGKMGECIAHDYLAQLGSVSPVDFTIYKAPDKSHDYDLRLDGVGVQVKTRNSLYRFPASWVFQWGSNQDPIFKGEPCLIVFVVCSAGGRGEVEFFEESSAVLPLMREPILERLRGEKRVIMASDLRI